MPLIRKFKGGLKDRKCVASPLLHVIFIFIYCRYILQHVATCPNSFYDFDRIDNFDNVVA